MQKMVCASKPLYIWLAIRAYIGSRTRKTAWAERLIDRSPLLRRFVVTSVDQTGVPGARQAL